MSAVLRRLDSLVGDLPIRVKTGGNWEFSTRLAEKKVDFFQPLVRIHPLLEMEYNVHCTLLNQSVTRIKHKEFTEEQKQIFIEQLFAALAYSELLAHIHYYYLQVPREVIRLQEEQKCYRQLLQSYGYQFPKKQSYWVPSSASVFQKLRETSAMLNWPRLFSVRFRRVVMALLTLVPHWTKLAALINVLDRVVGPTLNHLAWIFFFPRLTINLLILFKHLIPNPLMAKYEKELLWWVRLEVQLQRRWFLLANDSVWFTAGILSCFVLTGTLAPIALYVTIAVFFYDILLAGLRAHIELRRMSELRAIYCQIEQDMIFEHATEAQLEEIRAYQDCLEARFSCDSKRVWLAVVSTSILFLGMCLALPLFANPIVPFIGAIIVVTATLATYLVNKWIDSQMPSTKIDKLQKLGSTLNSPHRLFRPAESAQPEKEEASESKDYLYSYNEGSERLVFQ